MVIDDLDLAGMPGLPDEANAPLVVDADAVLSGSITLEGFKPIAGGHPQIIEGFRGRELGEFPEGDPLDVGGKPPRPRPSPDFLRLLASEILNHRFIV
jgi:hypothetical protein